MCGCGCERVSTDIQAGVSGGGGGVSDDIQDVR